MVGKPPKPLNSSLGTYIEYKFKCLGKKDMTYILGARCSDGVVIVSDSKVTIDEGADYAYSKKILMPFINVAMGAAGIGGLYKDFQNRMVSLFGRLSRQYEKDKVPFITNEEDFYVMVTDTIRSMHENYNEDRHLLINNIMIMCATRIGSDEAQLITFNGYGIPEPINKNKPRAIGHGEPYGSLFLKKMWKVGMTMEQTAKLGLFIIEFIKFMRLDNSVGYDDEFLPQVIYIPDLIIPADFNKDNYETDQEFEKAKTELLEKYKAKDLESEDVQHLLNQVTSKVADFENFFKQGQLKL